MNILIPHNWLLEHLETAATPEELQKIVSLSGPSIERINSVEGESVYDIEITTNRVDSMSVRGIAREAAVILAQAGVEAHLKQLQISPIPAPPTQAENSSASEKLGEKTTDQRSDLRLTGFTLSSKITSLEGVKMPKIKNNPALCKRIICVILDNIEHTPTPDWMAKRLKQIEQNVHDSVIDITNYITHELGHPCHAFDYDKLMSLGGTIRVVEAASGKKFTTLDGENYETVGGEVVFENENGEIIDLPAIKGTANTAVDDNTKRVLFWIESIDHEKVRFGSMKHAIRTIAAQLNEKQVDPYLAETVLARGVELYQQLCHATVASVVHDEFPGAKSQPSVSVAHTTFKRYLGIEIKPEVITEILTKLGCEVSYAVETQKYAVQPPTFRPDLEIEADFVEEIARIYGYHNLPSTLMDTAIPLSKPEGTRFDVEHACKLFLAHIGWQEVYTYSLVSDTLAKESGYTLEEHLKLQNPLTDDRVYLRRTLIPSLVEVLDANPQRKGLSVFEVAHTYNPQTQNVPIEELHLTMVGQKFYQEVRGDFEALLRQFYVTEISVTELSNQDKQHAQITVHTPGGDIQVGEIYILKNERVVFDILVSELLRVLKTHPTYQPLPKAESVKDDFTFSLPQRTPIGAVIEIIKETSELVSSVELTGQYNQNFTFAITYLDPEKSLSREDVEPIRKRIIAEVAEKAQGSLVGAQS